MKGIYFWMLFFMLIIVLYIFHMRKQHYKLCLFYMRDNCEHERQMGDAYQQVKQAATPQAPEADVNDTLVIPDQGTTELSEAEIYQQAYDQLNAQANTDDTEDSNGQRQQQWQDVQDAARNSDSYDPQYPEHLNEHIV